MNTTTDAKLVAIAASELDTENPGWAEKVNLDTLNLWSSQNCVLGQVYGNYVDAPYGLTHDAGGNTRHEFNVADRFGAHWVREIQSRTGTGDAAAAVTLAAVRADLKLAGKLKKAGHKDLAKQLQKRALARV